MNRDNCKESVCKKQIMAVHDTMDLLKGKWKISIMASLYFNESRRFTDILNDVSGISNKMLSKELKDLEMNKLVTRTVLATQPLSVKYELTEYGQKFQQIIKNLSDFGIEHRKFIIGEKA